MIVLAENLQLSRPQQDLLCRGLSFIPSLRIGQDQKAQLQLDMQQYHRRISLAVYYRNSKNSKNYLPFTGSSGWTPPLDTLPPAVRELIEDDKKVFGRCYKRITESLNISSEELRALQELKRNKTIVIKPADKGSAVVILSRDQYILEVERQLNNAEYYKKLDKPMYPDTIPIVVSILDELKKKKFITAKQRKYLFGTCQPRERRFYILPKIHKDPEKWTVPHRIPPGRPIVSDCGSETYGTAAYLDFFLNPLSMRHPAFVKDTGHFLDLVRSLRVPASSFFFSMDVDNLYTNIPIEAGIGCVRRIFEQYPDPKRPDVELLKLLDINLCRNDFVFDDKYYLQVKGTAMGKRFAPAYANIFMAYWEHDALRKCKVKPIQYLRYLDDIWGIWTGSADEFREFVEVLNSHDPSIKLKVEFDSHSINFLDTTVFKAPGFVDNQPLDVKVYFKPTDTHALLHRDSFHPSHTFAGILKSQLIRFRRICTRDDDFKEATNTLFRALTKRGYTRSFLRGCYRIFREGQPRVKDKDREVIPLITTFSTISGRINWQFKLNFENILGPTGIIPTHGVISAYRRNRNLKDLLVRAQLPKSSLLDWVKPHRLDSHFIRLHFVNNRQNRTIHKIQQGFTLWDKNCVYLLFCIKCGKQYVGETKNTLSMRMIQHKYNIKNRKDIDTPLVLHFLQHGLDCLRFAGLEKNAFWTDWERKKRERYWIFLLSTKEPFGLNVKLN